MPAKYPLLERFESLTNRRGDTFKQPPQGTPRQVYGVQCARALNVAVAILRHENRERYDALYRQALEEIRRRDMNMTRTATARAARAAKRAGTDTTQKAS